MKKIVGCLLIVLLITGGTGCSKDEVVNTYNNVIQLAGKNQLTSDIKLTGKREKGVDDYVGKYSANYKNFSNTEYIFGGTSINHKSGNKLKVTYNTNADNGSIKLILKSGNSNPVIICDSNKFDSVIELPDGSNYLSLKGDNFTGNTTLNVTSD